MSKEFVSFSGIKKLGNTKVCEFEYNVHSKNRIKVLLRNIKYLSLLFYLLIKHRINLIHSHRLIWSYVAFIPSVVLKIPLITHIVVIEEPENFLKYQIVKIFQNVTYVAVSRAARDKFINIYNIDPIRVKYHYGGLYFSDINKNLNVRIKNLEFLKKKGKILIGMISRMHPLKGIDVFVEAAGILSKKYPQLYFVHIGHQKEYKETEYYFYLCKKRVVNLGLSRKFAFVNYTDNVLPYYKYFYLTVLPSYKDTLAYANIEANAYGVPAIFTRIDGMVETSDELETCTIPFPPSGFLLSKKVEVLLNDKNKYMSLQKKVKQFAQENFDSNRNAKYLDLLYKKLVS